MMSAVWMAYAINTAPKAVPPSSVRYENALLIEQLIDTAQTQYIVTSPCKKNTICGYESDPLAKPFVHSPLIAYASTIALNGAIRLLPESRMKVLSLKIVLGVEAVNIYRNFHVMVIVR